MLSGSRPGGSSKFTPEQEQEITSYVSTIKDLVDEHGEGLQLQTILDRLDQLGSDAITIYEKNWLL